MSASGNLNFSAATQAFDRIAASYDDTFTRTLIGQAQRKQVWNQLLQAYAPGARLLELNCGTGEDALFLAKRGRSVVACDGSAEMVKVASARAQEETSAADVAFHHLANEELHLLPRGQLFDGAYSNFSGLNCVSDLQPVARELASLIRPGGRVLICLWSRVCVGELVWYLLHGEMKKAVRRFAGKVTANVGGMRVAVSYPTVSDVRCSFAPWFELDRRRAVGFFVPPSYAESWARKHGTLMGYLEKVDAVLGPVAGFRDLGDHVLLEFTRCNR